MSRTDIEPVYYYSILGTHIMGTHRRHTTSNVVQFIELNRWGLRTYNGGDYQARPLSMNYTITVDTPSSVICLLHVIND